MATDVVYTLTVTIDGEYIAECVAGGKGSGEAKIQLEKELRGIAISAKNTHITFKTLVQESP